MENAAFVTETKDDGGPAFPVLNKFYQAENAGQRGSHLHYHTEIAGGLTKREWFAGQALAGMLANSELTGHASDYIKWSYEYADAMLAEGRK